MLFIIGATLILSHEQTRTQLEVLVQEIVPILSENLFYFLFSTVFMAMLSLVYSKTKGSKKDVSKKQGAYGQVIMHEHSLLEQLSHPNEIFSAIQLVLEKKLFKNSGSKSFSTRLSKELWDHLNKTSRSFAAVIRVLPSPDCSDAVCVFYLLLRALDTIEDEMDLAKFEDLRVGTETLLECKVRLLCDFYTLFDDNGPNPNFPLEKLLKSPIGAAAEKALLNALPTLIEGFHKIKENAVVKQITKEMGKGMSEYVIRDMKLGTTDEADYDRYCHIVAGLVGKGLTEIFCNLGYEDSKLIEDFDSWNSMGLLLQRTNITRDVCEDAAEGRSWWPQSIWKSGENAAESLKDLNDLSILNKMVCNAMNLIPQGMKYLDRLHNPAVFGFCALPQIMAIATLDACYANPNVFTGVVKIRAGQAAQLVLTLRQPTIGSGKRAYKREAVKLINHIRSRAVNLQDLETVAACDRALVACGGRVEKKLVTTSNTQIALSYAVFLSAVYLVKNQNTLLAKIATNVETLVGGDPGLTLAVSMALASGFGLSLVSASATLFSRS